MGRLRAGLGLLRPISLALFFPLLLPLLSGAACQGAAAGPPAPSSIASIARSGSVRPFTEAVAGTAGYLDPLYANEDNAREIDGLIYQGLTRVGADQQAEPLLASAVAVSADRLTYTVTLRAGISWADSQPLTVADVLFTFVSLQDPSYNGPEAAAWKGVTVKQTGDLTVDFALKAPSAAFPLSLRIGIMPQHLFPGGVGSFPVNPHSGAQALGTGPFQVESISSDRSLVILKRNPRAVPAPKLDRFIFKGYGTLVDAAQAVARGEADAVGGPDPTALAPVLHLKGTAVNEIRTFSFASVFLNIAGDPALFGSPAVRRALTQAIDRQKVIDEVLGGRADPQLGPLPPSDWAYSAADAGAYGFDPVAAARAFEEAGWTLPGQALYRTRGGSDFEVGLVAADAFPYRQVAASLRTQLLAVGVGVKVSLVPVAQLVSRYLVGHRYDMALASYDNGPDPDQFALWHSSQRAYPLNFSNLPKQAFIDKDLEDGRSGADAAQRRPAYADLQKLMADAVPALFLYEPHYLYAVSKRVTGVRINPAIEAPDRFEYVAEWSIV